MSGGACKAAYCSGNCLEGISDVNVREFFTVTVHLVAGGHFKEDELFNIIRSAEKLEEAITEHQEKEREIMEELKLNLKLDEFELTPPKEK